MSLVAHQLSLPRLLDVSGIRGPWLDWSSCEHRRIRFAGLVRVIKPRLGKVLAVRNAPSPGATSSMTIAEYICDELFNSDN
jgi:L-2-hydroxyglutarate oxidase LhgO